VLDVVCRETADPRVQVSLAWCLHRPWDVLPIPGSSRPQHLHENAGAAEVKLTPAQVKKLDDAFQPSNVKGDRL
jgi:aryl-alcohol dehydrogenase-like predicted oxidoreductase